MPVLHSPCPACRALMKPAFSSHKMSRQARGYDAEYDRNRDLIVQHVIMHGGMCVICGRPFYHDQKITAEHMIPLRAGGGNGLDNLGPAHSSCNSRGGGRARRRR